MSDDLTSLLKNLRLVRSPIDKFVQLDQNRNELTNSQISDDIKDKCLALCQKYLSGSWRRQTVATIDVHRIPGGLSNQMYYCGIKNPVNSPSKVPQEVTIRLYGPKHFVPFGQIDARVNDNLIGVFVSVNNLGPKVHGIFEDGQIQRYYRHRHFGKEEQKNPLVVRQVFHKLAKIHAMNVALKRRCDGWVFDAMDYSYADAFHRFPIDKEIKDYNCRTLMENELRAEMDWVRGVIECIDSPIVVAHNDFRPSNLMITEPDDELVVCDFEFSNYGYRGQDFGLLMREWGRDPYDLSVDGLPLDDSVFEPLVSIYKEECAKIRGQQWLTYDINSMEHIIKEAKLFMLNSYLFDTCFLLNYEDRANHQAMSRRVTMVLADLCFKNYLVIKKRLVEQNLFENCTLESSI